jgi:peroxiredoxin
MIQIGSPLPDATLWETTAFGDACPIGPTGVSVAAAAKGRRIAIFGLPGAYTETCSAQHLPGYVARAEALRARGVDEIWCVSVNDGYVMAAWGREHGAIGKVRMLGDGSGELTKKLGLDEDLSRWGLGLRSARYSMLVEDGIVKRLNVEKDGGLAVSDADTLLRQLG